MSLRFFSSKETFLFEFCIDLGCKNWERRHQTSSVELRTPCNWTPAVHDFFFDLKARTVSATKTGLTRQKKSKSKRPIFFLRFPLLYQKKRILQGFAPKQVNLNQLLAAFPSIKIINIGKGHDTCWCF